MRTNIRFSNVALIAISPFILSSCDSVLAGIGGLMCSLAPDSDHCYQWSAVQSGDPERCELIKGTKFKGMGSNPPKDKCYLTIAENTGNYSACDKIVGWPMSYSKSECVVGAAIKKDDPEGCRKLSGGSSEYLRCVGATASSDKVKTKDAEFQKLREALSDDPQDKELRAKYEAAKKDLNSRYDLMDPASKAGYFKERREATMKDVEDEDVRQSIAKEFNQYKTKNPNATFTDLVNGLDDVTARQKLIKELDENANKLVDDVKWKLTEYVDGKLDEAKDAAGEKASEAAGAWIDKNASESMKYQLQKLSALKDKYDKASETYKELEEKYGKVKAVYDEAVAIQSKVKEFDKLVGEGKIDEKQAKVLKGWVLLGKGLEYVTGYVPVFGSTISTISKETFQTVIKVAEKRAERSHGLDKCMSDPEHCDPSGISGY